MLPAFLIFRDDGLPSLPLLQACFLPFLMDAIFLEEAVINVIIVFV